MAKNDKILLDGIIDDRIDIKLPSNRRDEAFEYLAFEQILKDYDLSGDEIKSGSVDGRNDGGIDGFFIFVNGHLLTETESFTWPRTGSQLEVFVITCKHHDTFKQSPLDNLVASLSELLDLGIPSNELKGSYSELILKFRANLKLAYRKLSPRMSSFSLNFAYASRGDTSEVGESIVSRAEQIKTIAKDSFGSCNASFKFYGCSELIELHRRMPLFSLELPFLEVLARGERYILLAKLKDYYEFISDEGKLRRYLFDSNVRDFMGLNRVNEDIRATLEDEESPDFWWLNNGITILATSASLIGKSIQLQDIQIVNGLQTTESIFRYFDCGSNDKNDRAVLVKIIVSKDEVVRDSIIRATNNQTDVEIASLHATDKIQRDIEDVLKRSGFYYERRKNYYKNLGHLPSEIVTPLYLASGFVSLILKSPYRATRLKSRFMRSDESYNTVFSEKVPLEVWPKIALILKTTDEALERLRPTGTSANERFLKNWRQIISFLAISKLLGKFDFSAQDLIEINGDSPIINATEEILNFVSSSKPSILLGNSWKNNRLFIDLVKEVAEEFSVRNFDLLNKMYRFKLSAFENSKSDKTKPKVQVSEELVQEIDELLPPQPWKPGIHRVISKQLSCTTDQYFSAVSLLIKKGIRNHQKDGVVYDSDGNVICFDPDRVDPDTLELLDE
ncbi:MAG: AIPR family protein [Synechococcales cyanobacterium K44_A2020_017]|nr:AIPR family protein [Synechococcales cyanobacterium K32_A2020_035]MBF2093590.1 AIPR family protein [Synechococcales cyanobacterium K44_A2020_017]